MRKQTQILVTSKARIQTYSDPKDHVHLTEISLQKRKKYKPLEDMECFLILGKYAESLSNYNLLK